MNKTDLQLKREVEDELRWDPKVNSAHIGVIVEDGAVSLLGAVDTYAEKWAAEVATKRVCGVRTVAQDLTVKILAAHRRSDTEIAGAVENALSWDVFVPNSVTATVTQGAVTLEGTVHWNYQRDSAVRAVRYLAGVVSVNNFIAIEQAASSDKVKERVEAALRRQATADAKSIHVETSGGRVTLSGHASSWHSVHDASNAAWAAPGVTEVVDHVEISLMY